ncbi:unnamed protein product [Jaminaea pallidilutea]
MTVMDGIPATGTQRGNFTLLQSFALPYAKEMKVQKWKSTRTGLTLVWADFPSPLLNAYMTVPTEIFTDSGVPHTLEHLIFLGSHDYPYKGILDSLANRSFASGTNAWTAGDHTAYTLTTASSDGFLRMLPVYTDHLFRPTMTDAAFTTEVYHVNPKGQDAGVVYSEMQGRQNLSADLMELRASRALYQEGNAYRSDTGGLMEKLRVLTAQEIRDYHAKYYAPHNTALVVTGPLPLEELLQTANTIDNGLMEAGLAPGPSGPPGWRRPFLETASAQAPLIDGSAAGDLPSLYPADPDENRSSLRRKTTVEFPEDDESMGEVYITWLGPKLGEWLEDEAINVLSTYLTDSAVSPVQKTFIERDDPLCTDIYLSSESRAGSGIISAFMSSVPTEKLESLDVELVKLLESVATNGIDMDRMQLCIRRDRVKLMNQLETKPADSFADVLIQDHVYGAADGSELATSMDDMARYDELAGWDTARWSQLIRRWFVDNGRLVVIGRPSKALGKKLRSEVKQLEEDRRAELGEGGLKKLGDNLESARKENDRPIPEEILSGFRVPSKDTIAWIPTGRRLVGQRPQNGSQGDPAPSSEGGTTEMDKQLSSHLVGSDQLPFAVHFTQAPSAFVTISLVFATSALTPEQRTLMQLYLSTLFALPIRRGGSDAPLIPYEEVVKGLDEDTVEYEAGLSVGGGFAENICIEVKVEKAKYAKSIEWLRDLIWRSDFAVERLKVATAKIVQSLPELKRDGRSISWSLLRSMTHDVDKSTNVSTSILSLVERMPQLNERLASDSASVVADFEKIRSTVFRPDNLVVAIGGDVCGVQEPLKPWKDLADSVQTPSPAQTPRIPWSREVLSPLGRAPSKRGLICSLPTIESSYAVFTSLGLQPPNYSHPDNPALVVAIAILNALESVLWRYIRGAGLAYGASLRSDIETGQIHFSLYRSPDSSKAFIEARNVIQALLGEGSAAASQDNKDSAIKLEQIDVDSAKSMLHFSVADSQGTVSQACAEVFLDEVMRGVPRGRGRRLLEGIQSVTLDDVKSALRKYVLPVFDPSTSICAIVSSPGRVDEISAALKEVGYAMERRDLDVGEDDDAGSEVEMGSSGSGSDSSGDSSDGGERV